MNTIEKVMQKLQQGATNSGLAKKSPSEADGAKLRIVKSKPKSASRWHPEIKPEKVSKIELEALNLEGYLNPNSPDLRLLEEYRRVKRPLVINALEREGPMAIDRGNLIMVTSSLPGEGKSYSAANIALSISMERDITVLLIDCDVHKRALSKLFHCENAPGILDFLDNPLMDMGDVLVDVNVPNLSFVPAGVWRQDSAELLAGIRMSEMAREISERYSDRIVIFDSPPLLACNDSSVLARDMGQIVMVVEAEATPKNVLIEALGRLPADKFVGLVFNKALKNDQAGYYGNYYVTENPENAAKPAAVE